MGARTCLHSGGPGAVIHESQLPEGAAVLVHEYAAILDGRRVDAALDHVEVVALLRLPGQEKGEGWVDNRSVPLLTASVRTY